MVYILTMILRRSEILAHIAAGKSNRWIAKNCRHGRELISQVRTSLDTDASEIDVLEHPIDAPTKITPEITERIRELTDVNQQMSSDAIARIIKRDIEELQPGSKEELLDGLVNVWDSLEMNIINALIDSMSR
jgi:hypothetical protein